MEGGVKDGNSNEKQNNNVDNNKIKIEVKELDDDYNKDVKAMREQANKEKNNKENSDYHKFSSNNNANNLENSDKVNQEIEEMDKYIKNQL